MLLCEGKQPDTRKTSQMVLYPHDSFATSSSLAVVENLRGKCKGEFILSFSESVHPIVPQKKNPH